MSHGFTLAPGEVEVRRWGVSWRSFLGRCLAMFAATMVLLSPMIWYGNLIGYLLLGPIMAPLLMWVFDDFRIWRDNRGTVWLLTNQALHIHGPQVGEDVDLRLALQEIRRIGPLPPWSLVLRLESGVAITLPLVPERRALRAQILAARDAMMTGKTG